MTSVVKYIFVPSALILLCSLVLRADDTGDFRALYYRSVEDASAIGAAYDALNRLESSDTLNPAVIQVYRGSLRSLEGKHDLRPVRKYRLVIEGLEMMESARLQDSLNVEVLFIQGMTTWYLPFFFEQKSRARNNFHNIIRELPNVYGNYPQAVVRNVLNFIEENLELCPDESNCAERLRRETGYAG